jgi:hypothetical protein
MGMKGALITVGVLLLAACNMSADAQHGESGKGGGKTSQRSYQVGSFDRVSLAGSTNVVVSVGAAPSVRAEGDSELLERLEVKVENGELIIGTRKGKWSMGFNHDRAAVTVYVTAPALAAASISGSGDMKIDKVEGGKFTASIGGSGDLDIASLRVGAAAFSIAGSGGIRGAGTAETATISVAGSGDVRLEGLEARRASVSVVGSGDVRAKAMETAEISVTGSGDVELAGTAKCTVNKVGSGDVRCTG